MMNLNIFRLNNLEKAIKVAGLEDILSGPGPFTLLAPIDNAFNKLSPEELQVSYEKVPS